MTQVHLYNGQPYTNQKQLDELRAEDIKRDRARAAKIAEGKKNIESIEVVKEERLEIEKS